MTEQAVSKALEIAQREAKLPILRIGVQGGGCSGMTYVCDFADSVRDEDHRWLFDEVQLVCDPKSYVHLNGTEIDYETHLLRRGFRFNNPKAKRSCSCGESFGVA